jgi:hypothetical protein
VSATDARRCRVSCVRWWRNREGSLSISCRTSRIARSMIHGPHRWWQRFRPTPSSRSHRPVSASGLRGFPPALASRCDHLLVYMSPRQLSRRKARAAGTFVTAVIAGVTGLFLLYIGAGTHDNYSSGTPTTATVTSCSTRGTNCWGNWTIDGKQHHGQIGRGFFDRPQVGSTLDVHVSPKGKTAYTSNAWLTTVVPGGVLTVVSIGLLISSVVRFVFRNRL